MIYDKVRQKMLNREMYDKIFAQLGVTGYGVDEIDVKCDKGEIQHHKQ